MQTMFGLHFPLCFFLLAGVFSLDPYFVLITFIKFRSRLCSDSCCFFLVRG